MNETMDDILKRMESLAAAEGNENEVSPRVLDISNMTEREKRIVGLRDNFFRIVPTLMAISPTTPEDVFLVLDTYVNGIVEKYKEKNTEK